MDVEAAINTGRWWDRKLWNDPIHQPKPDLRADQVEEALAALREIFDEEWANDQIDEIIKEAKKPVAADRAVSPWEKLCREKLSEARSRCEEYNAASSIYCVEHPIFGPLFHQGGRSCLSPLRRLGSSLKVFKQHDMLGDLPGRLKVAGEFNGASAELNVLAGWLEVGVKAKRNVPSGRGKKNCDFKIWNGEEAIFGDVKRLEKAAANKERSSLTDEIVSKVLARLNARGLQGCFDMELLFRPRSREQVIQYARTTDSLADEIALHVEQHIADKTGGWRVLAGLVKYRHISGDARSMHGGAGGVPLDMRAEADKLMDVVHGAADQIPASGPGVIIIVADENSALFFLSSEVPERIVERFKDGRSAYADISGVIIMRAALSPLHGEIYMGTYVPNPNGPRLSMPLLKQGVGNLQEWDGEGKKFMS